MTTKNPTQSPANEAITNTQPITEISTILTPLSLKPTPVAIDVGSGYVKIISNGTHLAMPSAVAPFPVADFFKSEEAERIDFNGQSWIVGESAVNTVKEDDRQNTLMDEWAGSPGWQALLYSAIAKLQITGPIHIITGIPQAQYSDRDRRTDIINALKGEHVVTWMGEQIQFTIEKVRIIPQAAGAMLCKAAQDDSVLSDIIGIIDIGTYTTGYSVLKRGEFMQNKSGGISVGVSDLVLALANHFDREYRVKLDSAQIHEVLMTKKIRVRGELISIENDIDRISKRVASPIQEAIAEYWHGGNDLTIFVAGGGAPYFINAIHEVARHAILMDGNFFAVATGMHYYLEIHG